jgi:hypothetical protein
MYGKRVFKTLTTLFMLFGLVGCGGSGGGNNNNGGNSGRLSGKALTSVSELHYFPDSNITGADDIGHTIKRVYKSETDRDTDKNTFKNKYNISDPYGNASMFVKRYPYPLGVYGGIERVALQTGVLNVPNVSYENPYYNYITLDEIGDTIKRDDALFEEVFGYKGGILANVDVLKTFHRNATAELKAYGDLLVKDHGFKMVKNGTDTLQWQRADDDYIYDFGYTIARYNPYTGITSQTAGWDVNLAKPLL